MPKVSDQISRAHAIQQTEKKATSVDFDFIKQKPDFVERELIKKASLRLLKLHPDPTKRPQAMLDITHTLIKHLKKADTRWKAVKPS